MAEVGQSAPHQFGGDEEEGHEEHRAQGELPGQAGHGDEDEDQRDRIAHGVGQDRREGLLRADDVLPQPGDQGPRLRAGEEGDRLAQDVAEDLGAQVVDQALTDPGGQPALGEGDDGREESQPCDEHSKPHDDLSVAGDDPVVDERLEDQRGGDDEDGVDDDEDEERGDPASIGPRIGHDPLGRAVGESLVLDAGVARHAPHHLPALLHAHRRPPVIVVIAPKSTTDP